jgi:DNA-binding FadR family transcriptional regulator
MDLPAIAPFDSRRIKLVGPAAAEQIIADVIELGWPVGHVLGSEAELLERYGISRAVLREAVRLVEHQRVARMRRGPGGGLVIDEPDIDTVISAIVLHLMRVDATLDEVIDTRVVVEELVAEVASNRITEDAVYSIRETLREESTGQWPSDRLLHAQLAALTANPLVDLFVDVLTRIGEFFYVRDPTSIPPRLRREAARAHEQIARAVLAKNPGLARVRMRRHLLAEADFIRRQGAAVERLPPSVALRGAEGNKRADAVARNIFANILKDGLTPGAFVGSEATLMAQQQASRAVLREAVRLLEYHHIASMRRGPGGGLFVEAPDASALTDIVAIYLRRRGVSADHVVEVLVGLELAVLERVSQRLAGDNAEPVAAALRAYLDGEPPAGTIPGLNWHSMLASLTGNRALEIVHRVTLSLGWLFFSRIAESDPSVRQLNEPSTVEPAHRGITEALLTGDLELATMRMRAHGTADKPTPH